MQSSPAFGQADLTNCERELIHLAGSIQPHGVLLVVDEPGFNIVQVTRNAVQVLGIEVSLLLGQPLSALSGSIEARVRQAASESDLSESAPIRCHSICSGERRDFEGSVHRPLSGGIVIELEELRKSERDPASVSVDEAIYLASMATIVQQFSGASNIGGLADAAVKAYRELTGYDRVMVYKFDPDGHGKIIAEAREARLDSLLGHHYPASDIPQRARELYIRNRVRVLVDVHYDPVPLVPARHPETGEDLDMSLCYLRSMSPLHLQYLKNMGVTATLVVSLIRNGKLWGLVAAHHYSPRNLRYSLRIGAEILAEVLSTRISAIENYAHAQVAILVRRLEQRLIEATAAEGDWRLALFRSPRTLLQPLEATGAALFCDGEILTTGEVPSTPELRALLDWVAAQDSEGPFQCSSVGRANPELSSLTPVASGVLAVRLSPSRPDYLMWFRKEQLLTVTWAGDPAKPVLNNNPLELSPRRSFAAWSEIVRGTALPWTTAELALGRAIGVALVDIILQVHAVRLLIAEHQIEQIRSTVGSSAEPVVIASPSGKVLFTNEAFTRLVETGIESFANLVDISFLFTEESVARHRFDTILDQQNSWRGEMVLAREEGPGTPVSIQVESVNGPDGMLLGFIVILNDLTDRNRSERAREQLEKSLSNATQLDSGFAPQVWASRQSDSVINGIVSNASLAAMDIADASSGPSIAALLEEIETSTKRATALYARIRSPDVDN